MSGSDSVLIHTVLLLQRLLTVVWCNRSTPFLPVLTYNEIYWQFNILGFDFFLFSVVTRFFHPRHIGQWLPTSKDFYTRSYPLHYFLILFLRKSQYFPFQGWVLNKGTTGTIFITSLVWRGPWLGIEPETSGTRSQHSTTRLSRRQCPMTLTSVFFYSGRVEMLKSVMYFSCFYHTLWWAGQVKNFRMILPLMFLWRIKIMFNIET